MAPWIVPALVVAGQVAYWPGIAIVRGDDLPGPRVVGCLAVAAALGVVLGFRRRWPVRVAVAASIGIGVGGLAGPPDVYFEDGDALLIVLVADLVALFSVAVRCSRRTTLYVAAGLVAAQFAFGASSGFSALDLLDAALNALIYGIVAAGGRMRRKWVAERASAQRRLAEAEAARQEAAAAERRRLARELHDVTAHHLTSIVVNATAAQFIGEQRPELKTEALQFAARTGRETLAALHRLVALLPAGYDEQDAFTHTTNF